MRSFRRSVIRLLLVTCFLLFVAWIGLKFMQYGGDWDRLTRDIQKGLQDVGVVEFFRDRVVPFFQKQVAPKAEDVIDGLHDFVQSHLNG